MISKVTIAFDYSHNNKLVMESSSYSEFTQYLFNSGYKLGRIQAGFDSLEKLEKYDAIIVSTPRNKTLDEKEIDNLEEYVKKGGSLLIISSGGGDYSNRTNLNDLTQKFGFEFVSDKIFDSMNYVSLQKRPSFRDFKPHSITEQVKAIVLSSACSLNVYEYIEEEEENLEIEVILQGGLNCWHEIYNGKKWIEEDSPKVPLIVSVEYYEGKVVGLGTLSFFSSLGREYGFNALDNDRFIANMLQWLTERTDIESNWKTITINLFKDLYLWANSIIEEQNWKNLTDIFNVSLKYFKDNYKEIIDEITKDQLEKLKKKKEYKEKLEQEITDEDQIMQRVFSRKKEDLYDIIKSLEEITGEKYELSIDVDKASDMESSDDQDEPEANNNDEKGEKS
jgi:hypothetical protein